MSAEQFDPNGDLTLVVGKNPSHHFLVCSRTISRHSRVFHAMVNGPWAESIKHETGNWKIEFPEDDDYAFRVLLYAMHGMHGEMPRGRIETGDLYKVVALVDKYDASDVVSLWWHVVSSKISYPTFAPEFFYSGLGPKRLFIAWTFGHSDGFKRGIDHVVRHCRINHEDGVLIDDANLPISNYEIPGIPDLAARIAEHRAERVDHLLRGIGGLFMRLVEGEVMSDPGHGRRAPTSLVLGALVRSAMHEWLMPYLDLSCGLQPWLDSYHLLQTWILNLRLEDDRGRSLACPPFRLLQEGIRKERENALPYSAGLPRELVQEYSAQLEKNREEWSWK